MARFEGFDFPAPGIEIPDALSLINSLAAVCCNHVVLMNLPVGGYILRNLLIASDIVKRIAVDCGRRMYSVR
jgi:hypothetical protein